MRLLLLKNIPIGEIKLTSKNIYGESTIFRYKLYFTINTSPSDKHNIYLGTVEQLNLKLLINKMLTLILIIFI